MCNPSIIIPSSSFESISSYSPSSPSTGKRNHMRRGTSFRSMSNSYGRNQRDNHFLDSCFLCKTRLYLGDDIYMYKGDTPFCSEECRQDQIEIDETNEKMRSKMSLKKAIKSSKIDDAQVRTVATAVFA